MTITLTKLTGAAGLCAVAGGLLFIGVQINHPRLEATFVTTTEYAVRETVKIVMSVLSLIGITGIYLRQVKLTGALGLLGYVAFGAGYLAILSTQIIGVVVLPFLVNSEPGYVNDVLTVAGGGAATGDVGQFTAFSQVAGITFLAGGFLFGIALFRTGLLARWAAALLAVGCLATVARAVLPEVNPRLFAVPISVALIGLGVSLWLTARTDAARPLASPVNHHLDPAGAK